MEGTVVVPTEVQQLFSPEAPGQLFVVATLPAEPHEVRDDTTPIFCMPTDQQRSIVVRGFRFACAEAGVAQVAAYAVPSTADLVNCADGTVKPQRMYAPDDLRAGRRAGSGQGRRADPGRRQRLRGRSHHVHAHARPSADHRLLNGQGQRLTR